MFKNLFCFLYLIICVFCKRYNKVEFDCGFTHTPHKNEQIWNGKHLQSFEHPWFCHFDIVYNGENRHCSGTLISEEDIITSASCFDDSKLLHQKFKMLSCGSVNNMVALEPLDVKKHEAFGTHNLARIKIKKVAFSTIIRPICLTKYEQILQGSPVTVVGSGDQLYFRSDVQRKAEIIVRNTRMCENYGVALAKQNSTICAGEFLVGIRPGDEGAPLLAFHENRYYLIGVVSAERDELPNFLFQHQYPVLFTRIAPYCDTFLRDHSNVECHNNAVPIEATRKLYSCGAVSESRMKKRAIGHGLDLLQPWYCKIKDREIEICGGTLISFKHVLTAAHCLELRNPSKLTIHCGIELQTFSKVSRIVQNEEFDHVMLRNDIAILELEKLIEFDGSVGAACLIENDSLKPGQDDLIAVGSDDGRPMTVKSIKLKVSKPTNCQAELNLITDSKTSLCLEGEKVSTKAGDSGGPLLTKINERWHVVGVVSGGLNETTIEPSYLHFTRVSGFCNFIMRATNRKVYWSNNNDDSKDSSQHQHKISLLLLLFITVVIKIIESFIL